MKKYLLPVCIFVLAFCVITYAVYRFLPVDVEWKPDGPFALGVDWKGCIRPATLSLLSGQSPYGCLQNPPWVVIPLIPLALLPPNLGTAAVFTLGFFIYALTAYRLQMKPLPLVLFLLNPFTLGCLVNGNIDWMAAFGLTLSPPLGLFFLVLKPQLTIGVMIFWLIQAWQAGKLREVVRVFAPVSVALLLSFVIFGFWPGHLVGARLSDPYNASFWPTSLPLGVALLYSAIKNRNVKVATSSSVFCTPYISPYGYAIALLGLDGWQMVLVVVSIWAAFIMQAM